MTGKLTKEELNQAIETQLRGNDAIAVLSTSARNDVIDVFAEAFTESPMLVWVAGLKDDDPKRVEKLSRLSASVVGGWTNHRLVTGRRGTALGIRGANSELAGCMTLAPSSCVEFRFIDTFRCVINYGPPPVYKSKEKKDYCPTAQKRLDALEVLVKKRNEEMKGTQRWIYLQTIGVRPNSQGNGYGKQMLQLLNRTADSLGVSIYLETDSKANESLYRHFGYRTVQEVDVTVSGDIETCRMYLMRRDSP